MENQAPSTESQRRRRKGLGLILAGVAALAAGGALVMAHAGGGHGRMGHGMSIDEMSEHFQVHVKHVLAEVDATPDQQARVNEIIAAATTDLKGLRGQHAEARKALHAIFTAPSIDRVRLEQLRADHLAVLDAASKRCLTAMADAADVLTPEQRAQLGAKMEKRHGGWSRRE